MNRGLKKQKKGMALMNKMLRLLTLVSFFHFSGLNNGFTQIVVVSGSIQQTNFAPVAISKMAYILNPGIWKKCLKANHWQKLFFSSSKVIEVASKGAIERMLSEGNLLQMWVQEALKKNLKKSKDSLRPQGKEVQEFGSHAAKHIKTSNFYNFNLEIYDLKTWVWKNFLQANGFHKLRFFPWKSSLASWVNKKFRFELKAIMVLVQFKQSQSQLPVENFKGINTHQFNFSEEDPASIIINALSQVELKVTPKNILGVIFFLIEGK
ncbi:MAG: hypothetical protein A3I11_07700 [Elusimicrobia bacterium RIFCSPLOWO2_02_FULL_39_32]|nr:MAG: hypothetical protein A3B80_01000 [Elusimicrobia bacterium RIFCSPHIGHO2_02_FULL_39_36]OGR92069.1 MAG: hypothetical protein A3I11_07700 [Elusimicrobia bacterium RIFCSPLOWO2_02_FULL_39_32]